MRNITLWSVLTLLTVVIGGGATLLVDRAQLRRWGESGVAIPLGQPYAVDLPAGDMLVYYESSERVPTNNVLLAMRDAEGRIMRGRRPGEDNSYRLRGDGWSGRALWEYRDLEAGEYTVVVNNPHYASDEEIPERDRVVFAKQPNALADVLANRRRVHVIGIALTLTLAAAFYGAHIWAGRSR